VKIELLGHLGILNSRLQDDFDLKKRVFLAEISTETLDEISRLFGNQSKFIPPSQFPGGELDITLVLEEKQFTDVYLTAVQKRNIPELKSGFVHSEFRSEALGENKKAISYRFLLMSYDKTFTQERFKELSDLLVQIAKEEGFSLR
jgi:phenylalanyl-tRNA synthetase beta chain